MMKGVNTKDRLQIYKNKKSHCKYRGKMKKTCSRLIQFLQIIIVTKNFIYNIDTNLWHSRWDHDFKNSIKNFVIWAY
jgi:hypothetical protein